MVTFEYTQVAAASMMALAVVVTVASELRRPLPVTDAAGSVSAPQANDLDAGWQETEYLLASPANAAILRAAADRGSDVTMSIDEVWAHFGVPKE